MARQIQLRRGTAIQHTTFTGANGEVTVDTTNKTLRVHDGTTPGGTPLARADSVTDMSGADYVVAWQTPTDQNNYTWYRKYKSGWVEQGGQQSFNYSTGNQDQEFTCNLAKTFSNTNYTVCMNCIGGFSTYRSIGIEDLYTSHFTGFVKQNTTATLSMSWCAYGF